MAERSKVLVKERIADAGVELLRERFDVELGLDWDEAELERRIAEFDGILIRSATQLDAGLIEKGERLRVIGRAGTGVDNVDIEAATKRGIVVANAPEANSIAAAEHTVAVMLALCRNVPQAHGSLAGGAWERSRFKGAELYGKTLGVLGFGRIGQLVAQRAKAFEMQVVGYDKFVTAERFRELGVDGAETPEELYQRADFITLHLPKTPETVDFIDADAIAAMREGVRIVNCARGELVDLDALLAGLESGRVAGAALDVFPEEPFTDHPILAREDVVVTPHLGASTEEAQDRAGVVTAEQVTAALAGGVVTTAVNIAAVRPEVMEALAPFVPLCEKLGRLAQGLGNGAVDRVEVEFRGRLAEEDTRILGIAVLAGNPQGPHRGGGQPRQRPPPGRAARHRADRDARRGLGGLHRAGRGPDPLGRRGGRGGRHRGRPPQHPPPGSGLGRRLLPALRRAPGDLPLRRPAGHDRPSRHGLRRGGGQHRLGRGRRRDRGRHGGDGPDHRQSGQPVDDRPHPRAGRLRARPRGHPLAAPGQHRVRAMKAVVLSGHGGPEVLTVEDRPDPEPAPGQVRIAVRAAGINFADTLARVGLYPDAPKPPCVLGYEVAGEVDAVGDGVEDFKTGDRVMAGTRFGGQASMVAVDAEQVIPLPDRLSFEQGAAFPVNYATAYAALVVMGGLQRRGDGF